MSYKTPKYPRVLVSPARHKKLAAKAKRMKISIAELSERAFREFDNTTN